MTEAYPFFIVVSVFCFLMSLLFFYITYKETYEKVFFAICTCLWLLISLLLISGMLFYSEKLITAALLLPFGVFLLLSSMKLLTRLKKCTVAVRAKYLRFQTRGKYGWQYAPEFSYEYNGETFAVCSFLSYPKRTFKKLFQENGEYTIYINPEAPCQCADKRMKPPNVLASFLLSLLLLGFGLLVVVMI